MTDRIVEQKHMTSKPPFTCQFCGALSHVDPSDQTAPPAYCLPEDHTGLDPDAPTGCADDQMFAAVPVDLLRRIADG